MTGNRTLAASAVWVTAVVGAVVFAVAYDDGGYSLASRSAVARRGLVGDPRRRRRSACGRSAASRAAPSLPGALLAAFAAWTLASIAWSSSAEDAFAEFDRTALYLGVYVLAVARGRRAPPRRAGSTG